MGVFKCLRISVQLSVISWRQLAELDLVVDNMRILNEHSVNGELYDWHGIASIRHYTGSTGMIHRHLNKGVHISCNPIVVRGMPLYTGNLQQILWGCVLCHYRQQNVFFPANRQPQSVASIPSLPRSSSML